jgi:N-acylglucosamine-6-phosphate 2-epimerase
MGQGNNMIPKGIIVSVQNFSQSTTQELANICVENGAVAIRTDKPIECEVDLIGLMKLKNKKYYITTSIKSIDAVSLISDYVAIDSRKGNKEIPALYDYCLMRNINVVADIETIDDVKNILNKGLKPCYIATTFSFLENEQPNIELIKEIRNITNIPIIAEGGYYLERQIIKAIEYGANNVCIGRAVSKVNELTKDYVQMFMRGLIDAVNN